MMKNKKIIIAFLALVVSITTVSAFSQVVAPFPTKYYGDDLSKYIPGFSPEMCTGGSDFLVQVDPVQGCSPRVVRSDLLEENSVPIFCPLQAIKINPLLDVPEIKSITLSRAGQASKEIAGLSFYPARAALQSNTELIGSPTISNIGYLVAILQKQPIEKNMSDWVTADVTAHIEYDAIKTYGIGYKEIVSTELRDEAIWQSSHKQYGFWNGKGYIRVSDIEEDNARVDIYTDANNKIASYVLKQGDSERGYLPGFYCSAGYDVRLNSIRLPGIKARLSIDSDEATVTEGGSILDGKCSVSSIKEDAFGGGEVKLRCPDKTHYLRINPPKAMLAVTKGSPNENDYAAYEVGKKINVEKGDEDKVFIYLIYAGEVQKKDFVVVVRKSGEREITEAELSAINMVMEKTLRKRIAVGRVVVDLLKKVTIDLWEGNKEEEDFKASITGIGLAQKAENVEGLKKAIEGEGIKGKEGFIKKILGDSNAEVKLIIKNSPPGKMGYYNVYFKGFEGFEEEGEESNDAVKTFYEKAVNEYKEMRDTFPQEKNALGDFYGAISLEKAATLARDLGNKKESRELFEEIVDKYPYTPQAENAKKQLDLLRGYDSSKAIVDIKIRGKSHYVRLESVDSASVEDLGAELIVGGKQQAVLYGIGDLVTDKADKKEDGGRIIVDKIEKEEVTFSYEYKSTTEQAFFQPYKIRRGSTGKIGEVTIFVNSIKMNREAHVTVSPVMRGGSMDANFTFKIAIEKRAIKLSPEKTKELINTLNTSIAQWEKTVADLGNLVKTWKGACFVGAISLQVRAFLNNLGGGSIARSEVMKRYREFCADKVGIDKEFKSLSACYQHYNTDIINDINAKKGMIDSTNKIIRDCEEKSKKNNVIDRDLFYTNCKEQMIKLSNKQANNYKKLTFDKDRLEEFKETNKGKEFVYIDKNGKTQTIKVDDISSNNAATYNGESIYLKDDTAKVELDGKKLSNLRDKGDILTSDVKDVISNNMVLDACNQPNHGGFSAQYCLDFENDLYTKLKRYEKTIEDSKNLPDSIDFARKNKGLTVPRVAPSLIDEKVKEGDVYVATETVKKDDKEIIKKGERYTYGILGGSLVMVVVEKAGGGDRYTPNKDRIYKVESNEVTSNTLNPKDLTEKVRDDLDRLVIKGVEYGKCSGKFLDSELKVKYFETEPYKGLPAIVPFDKEGWYVAIPPYRVIGTQSSSAYDQSALLKNFWICNAGQNGRIEFMNSPMGDDAECCTQYREGMSLSGWVIDKLDEKESQNKLRAALAAVDTAANRYGEKQISIGGLDLVSAIQPVMPQAECEEFMDPSDCNLMFNLCDPVLCPTSRCNLGGNFPVDDVVQSGIIGSALLCLPNFGPPSEGGVLVPVCLTGIHAGLDNLVTILKASRDCLQESLNTGRNVGICDQIKSVYLCEFFWRQFTPFIKAGIPAIISGIFNKGQGGGEYLLFNDAWDKSAKSVQYFTNTYGLNAFKAFRARTTSEIGSDICRAFISQRYPSSTFLDKLTEPESPVQFSAWFDEIPLTTATLPARSQYKIYYHVYAGKDEGVNYYVYLKRTPGTSLYQQTEQVFVDSGFIPRAEFIDKTPDIIAPSGLQELCVVINMKTECGFGKVSTSFALNRLTDMYLAEQATKEVKNEEECMSGTPSINPMMLTPNIQAGVTESLQPKLMQQGIIRICSGSNPSTSTEPLRWKAIGYCDDEKKIRCWLDERSVKENIKSKDLQKEVMDKAEKSLIDIEGSKLMGDTESRASLSKLEKQLEELKKSITKKIEDLGPDHKDLADEIEKLIEPVKSGFEEVIEKSAFNQYKARAKYGFASLYDEIVRKLKDEIKKIEKKEVKEGILREVNLDENPTAVVTVSKSKGAILIIDGQRHTLTTISATVFNPDTKRPVGGKIKEKILIDGKDKIGQDGGKVELTAVTYDPRVSIEGSGAYIILDKNGLSNFVITLTDIKLEDNKKDVTLTFEIKMTAAASIEKYGCGYANGKNLDDCHKMGDKIKKECFFIKTGWGWFKSNECRECSSASCRDFSYDQERCEDKNNKCHSNLKCEWSAILEEGKKCFESPTGTAQSSSQSAETGKADESSELGIQNQEMTPEDTKNDQNRQE